MPLLLLILLCHHISREFHLFPHARDENEFLYLFRFTLLVESTCKQRTEQTFPHQQCNWNHQKVFIPKTNWFSLHFSRRRRILFRLLVSVSCPTNHGHSHYGQFSGRSSLPVSVDNAPVWCHLLHDGHHQSDPLPANVVEISIGISGNIRFLGSFPTTSTTSMSSSFTARSFQQIANAFACGRPDTSCTHHFVLLRKAQSCLGKDVQLFSFSLSVNAPWDFVWIIPPPLLQSVIN